MLSSLSEFVRAERRLELTTAIAQVKSSGWDWNLIAQDHNM